MTAIKICGITTEQEVGYLNRGGVRYAGFVLYEKSKRYVTPAQAGGLFEKLNKDIIKVAVTVDPDEKLLCQAEEAGFDILQVHGHLRPEILRRASIPVWRAVNVSGVKELTMDGQGEKIQAVLVDAPDFGSGKTFDWDAAGEAGSRFAEFRWRLRQQGKQFILAGGLTPENVAEGIRIFSPDIVDVSSGVEGTDGKKAPELIRAFKNAVNI